MKFNVRRAAAPLIFVVALAAFSTICAARPWKPTPEALALEYSQIEDARNHETVLIWWLTPPSIKPPDPTGTLDKYVIIGVVDAHYDDLGNITFAPADTLQASVNGRPLSLLTPATMPPAVSGILTVMQNMLGKSLGPMGQGIRWFVFDGGSFHSCGSGQLSVPYANETYTFDAPIPGCPTT
jgi:hypothetical protein